MKKSRPTSCGAQHPQACVACWSRVGTRQALLDGRLCWFCDQCPLPDEILAARSAIQDGWSIREEWARGSAGYGL